MDIQNFIQLLVIPISHETNHNVSSIGCAEDVFNNELHTSAIQLTHKGSPWLRATSPGGSWPPAAGRVWCGSSSEWKRWSFEVTGSALPRESSTKLGPTCPHGSLPAAWKSVLPTSPLYQGTPVASEAWQGTVSEIKDILSKLGEKKK